MERLNETLLWLEDQVEKQQGVALNEDPAFRVAEIDSRLKRIDSLYTRLNNTTKPKDTTKDSKKKKGKKMPKNIKIDNMTFGGDSDINWEDFVNIQGGADDEDESTDDTTQQQQKQDQQDSESSQRQ